MSPPPAHSVSAKGDDEVLSQRTFPDRGKVLEIVGVAPKDDSLAAGHMGEKAPAGTGDGGQIPFGSQPDTILETHTVLKSDRQPPLQEGEQRPLPIQRRRTS